METEVTKVGSLRFSLSLFSIIDCSLSVDEATCYSYNDFDFKSSCNSAKCLCRFIPRRFLLTCIRKTAVAGFQTYNYRFVLVVNMEDGCVTINQVPTRVITFGGWIDKPIRNDKLVLMITGKMFFIISAIYAKIIMSCFNSGNPGVIGYYEEFLHALYEELDGCFSVWGLGHAGHQVLTESQGPCVRSKYEKPLPFLDIFICVYLCITISLQRTQIYSILMGRFGTRLLLLRNTYRRILNCTLWDIPLVQRFALIWFINFSLVTKLKAIFFSPQLREWLRLPTVEDCGQY